MTTAERVTFLRTSFQDLLADSGRIMAPDKTEHSARFTRCFLGAPHPMANLAIAADQTEAEFHALLDDIEGWVATHRFPVALIVFPDVGRPERAAWLDARKWTQLDNMPGMWLEASPTFSVGQPPAGVSVRHADDDASLAQVVKVVTEGYPVPEVAAEFFVHGIHRSHRGSVTAANFIATVDGEPAACAAVIVRDGVAGIFCVATIERFRGRGLGALVTRAATAHGFASGARHALLHASPMGDPIYRKIGFQEITRIPLYGFGLG